MRERPVRVAIVHYRDDAAAGGSLRVGETLANHLDAGRVEAHLVFAYGGPGPVAGQSRVPCHFLWAQGFRDFRAWVRARAFMRRLKPDIVHFMDPVAWLRGALLGSRYAKLLHVHGRYLPCYMRVIDRAIARTLATTVDGQICITHGARRTLMELGWGRQDRIWTVHNAVDVKRFEDLPPQSVARARLGLPQHVKLVGMVCRMVRYRGCDDAVRMVSRFGGEWHLMLCGDGPFRGELAALAEANGVRDRVHFTGLLDDVRQAYAAMNVFLYLARYDSFGLAVGEAMAAGVPVFGLAGDGEYRESEYPLVTSDNSSFVERSQPTNYAGPEDPEVLDELARRIEYYAPHPERYRPMIEHARGWVRERFNADTQARKVTEVYNAVLQRL